MNALNWITTWFFAPILAFFYALYAAFSEFFYTWYHSTLDLVDLWNGNPKEWESVRFEVAANPEVPLSEIKRHPGIPDMPSVPPPPPKKEKSGCGCDQCAAVSRLPIKCQSCECISLIDGAYDVVALWHTTSAGEAASPSQVEWKKNWLAKAKKWGAGFDA